MSKTRLDACFKYVWPEFAKCGFEVRIKTSRDCKTKVIVYGEPKGSGYWEIVYDKEVVDISQLATEICKAFMAVTEEGKENKRLLRQLIDAKRLCAESWNRFYKLGESHGEELKNLKEEINRLKNIIKGKTNYVDTWEWKELENPKETKITRL